MCDGQWPAGRRSRAGDVGVRWWMVKRPVLVFTGERAETRAIGAMWGAARTATVEPPFAQNALERLALLGGSDQRNVDRERLGLSLEASPCPDSHAPTLARPP